MKLKSKPDTNNSDNDLLEKRKDLIEEYKIIQNKIDSYSSVLLRSRSIMISLISALFIFLISMEKRDLFIQIPIILLLSISLFYHFYYEYITNKSREIFQNRIFQIEQALKNNALLSEIELFMIGTESSKIKPGLAIFKTIYKNIGKSRSYILYPWMGLTIFVSIIYYYKFFYIEDKTKNFKPSNNKCIQNILTINEFKNINEKLDSIENTISNNIPNNDFDIINKKLNFIENIVLDNNTICNDLSNCCYKSSDK